MAEKYVVRLTAEEREELTALTSKGQAPVAKIRHAQVLLKADADGPNWPDARIADAFSIHLNTVAGIPQALGMPRVGSGAEPTTPSASLARVQAGRGGRSAIAGAQLQ
jgi:hypothetical protein